jgi:predicted GH43/DUF377 family glycosyl hydrolase
MRISKYVNNPILKKEMVPFPVNSIFNAGAVKYKKKYLLLCRVEMPNGRSSFITAESSDGYDFMVSEKPCLTPEDHGEYFKYAEWGIEDPRITQIESKFYITYTGYSVYMPLVMLAETEDFKSFKIIGPISEPSNKDSALFPEKINGSYWRVDRPAAELKRDIWLCESPDLIHWGKYKILASPIHGTWEHDKIGNSGTPVKTKEGWLMLYHGVRGFGITTTYRLGALLMDLEKPWVVIGRTTEPILSPELEYERVGDVMNVIFANGLIVEADGNVKIYYSGADTNICVADTSIEYLLSVCKKSAR